MAIKLRRLSSWVLPLTIALVALTGCGGSGWHSASGAGTAESASVRAGGDTVSSGQIVQRPQRGTGGSEVNDDNPSSADSGSRNSYVQNPCTLVSRSKVAAITGVPIATAQEAPLGPTCIFKPIHGEYVTVTIEATDFAKITARARGRHTVTVAGHTAFCGNYGRQSTFVALPHYRVLDIGASCAIGTRIAEQALPNIKQ